MTSDGGRAPRVAVFDVFGTVVDWRTSVARHVEDWASEIGARVADPFDVADRWRARYQPAMEPVRTGARPFTTLDVLHRESLVEVLDEIGVRAADADVDRLNLAWHALDPWPDSVDGLARIGSAIPVAPLSNGNVSLLIDMARRAGLRWDTVLGSDVARAFKPMPEAYLSAAALLGVSPSDCLMVAAHNSDLAAARACGLRTAFVARPTEHGHEQSSDLEPEQDWDYSVDSLTALADALGY